MQFERVTRAIPLILIAAGFGVYANSCSGPFIIDDLAGIVENPDIRHWGGWWNTIAVSLNSTISGRPLMWFTLAVNYWWHGLDVWGYHAVNVCLHVSCMLLTFGILRRTMLLPYWKGSFDNRSAAVTAGVMTALWGVHPLLTETVVYVSQRMELLSGLFYLLTLYFSIRAWDSKAIVLHVAAVASAAIGLLAKEQVASAPIAVILFDSVFVFGSLFAALRARALFYLGLASTWMIFVVLTSYGPRSAAVGFDLGVSAADYLRTQAGVLVHYLRLSVWPDPLCISYADWPIQHSWAASALPGLFILALLFLTVYALWKRSWMGYAGAWFFLILGPSSSFVPIITEIAAERRMYLPLISIIALAVAGGVVVVRQMAGRLAGPRIARPLVASITLLVFAGAAGATLHRNTQFRTTEAILGATLIARPEDELVRGALMQDAALRGDMDQAHKLFQDGLRVNPKSESVHYNWGECLAMTGNVDAAIEQFRLLLTLNAENHRAQRRLGMLLMQTGRAAEAVDQLAAGLWKAPEYFSGYNNLGVAQASLNRNDEAVASFQTAIELNPRFADAYFNLGSVLIRLERLTEAKSALQQAVQLSPHDITIRMLFAEVLEKSGDLEGAEREFRQIVSADPSMAAAQSGLKRLAERQKYP